METLQQKIDFTLIITATNANPNGDPLNGNRPRENFERHGEISDVCIKRKIRNRLQDMGEKIFVQSDDRRDDGFDTLKARAEANETIKAVSNGKKTDREAYEKAACSEWIDVRSFGQVFAFSAPQKGKSKKNQDSSEQDSNASNSGVSVGVRGPVSIQIATSVSPVDIVSMQITKSVNNENSENGKGKSSDTMAMKHRVSFGLYVINGSINCQLAEKTGFTLEDANKIKKALSTLFENDSSSARPEGSMEVCRLYWWEHDSPIPEYSSAKIHRSLHVTLKDGVTVPKSYDDYEFTLDKLEGVKPEVINFI